MGETLNIMKLYGLIKAKRNETDQKSTSLTARIRFSDGSDANQEKHPCVPEGKQDAERK